MTRIGWKVVAILAVAMIISGSAWWWMHGDDATTQPGPHASSTQDADDVAASTVRGSSGVSGSPILWAANHVPLPLPATIDPKLGQAEAAEKAVVTLRFDDPRTVNFDDRTQQLLGLREVDVDGQSLLAVITRDVQSGQVFSWSTSLSFRVSDPGARSAVLASLPSISTVFNLGERIVVAVDPPAIPAVLRTLAQDARVSDVSLVRIEPRARPQ